ncbi:MAG TPA: MFS transporter [Jiangellaceae bacterium]|nr:MFS transporter [Jiangellaceae bacterium]
MRGYAPTARAAGRASAGGCSPAVHAQAPDAAGHSRHRAHAHPRPHHHQRLLILDLAITNVALPTIQQAFQMTPNGLQWVVNAYAVGYGGFLLLGGRLADRLGPPAGLSYRCGGLHPGFLPRGLAPAGSVLIGARAFQGLGAALAGPAGLSILTTTFTEGPERNRALGVWSAVLASGGAVGMLAGGLLTRYLSWRWVLFVNVPVGALILAATPRLVPAYPAQLRARIDVAGASTITAGLTALVYATSQVPERGWTAPLTLGTFLAAVVLLGAFWRSRPTTPPLWYP